MKNLNLLYRKIKRLSKGDYYEEEKADITGP
nr:MAG TPA: hypothetical protein [Caudoviricetes sp.]